jgi:hypothetical protein
VQPTERSREARSGLAPWKQAILPEPPRPRGLAWLGVVGPGVIVLGGSIGSGEFLLGPAAFVRYGLSLLWVTSVAAFLQTVLNTELMRYTIATGEPVFTGFMRTKPHSTFWAWFYSILYFLQVGWPGWAGAAAGAIWFLYSRELAGPAQAGAVYWIGAGTFALCVGILLFGRRIERTLEILNWVLVASILSGFLILAVLFVPLENWAGGAAGLFGYDTGQHAFSFIPSGADFFLIGAFAAYSGAGGVINLTLSNWARDKGYGMGSMVGYIPAAVGGRKVPLASTGFIFSPDEASLQRWRGWWRIVRADQWVIYFTGALLGMFLPAILYVSFIRHGTEIRGLGVAAALADAMVSSAGPVFGGIVALMAVWVLFKTQLDIVDGTTRAITDILWTGSARVRGWRGGDVRIVYYGVLAVIAVWGVIALRLAQPILLLQLGANMAGIVFVISALHVLYINTTLLPEPLRPPLWRRVALVATSVFYGGFVFLWLRGMVAGAAR